ncbi:MAG: 4-hydroxy-tetrahydrodipicolinate reductase [Candidatus Gracilibacteria bacterium]|jgi:4-hydroxy-tetrahydrodipicolinate reductase
MNIALIGFGGMGKTVSAIAKERGHQIKTIFDPADPMANYKNLTDENLKEIDVAIDFSSPLAAMEDIDICSKAGVNLIMGTTGWYENMDKVKEIILSSDIGFLWSSNFSIGVNLYFKIIENASKFINNFDEYDIWGHEIHHYNKADSPSGTAKTLEQILLKNINRKTAIVEEKLNRKRELNEIHFSSVRGGLVNFGHTIGFDSPADTITISHSARNRDGYALGAVKAAEWIVGKKGFFEMEDFLREELSK